MNAFRAEFHALTGTEVAVARFESEASLGMGRAGLARLEAEGFETGVVFCSSDLIAHGVLLEAGSRGLAIPGEVAVIGFGDQGFAPDTSPPLTSMRVDRGALGASAALAILGRLEHGHSAPIVTDVGFEIVRRGSA